MAINRDSNSPVDTAYIIRAQVDARSQGIRMEGETNHEACGQDVDPDGRFGLRIRHDCCPDVCREWPYAALQS